MSATELKIKTVTSTVLSRNLDFFPQNCEFVSSNSVLPQYSDIFEFRIVNSYLAIWTSLFKISTSHNLDFFSRKLFIYHNSNFFLRIASLYLTITSYKLVLVSLHLIILNFFPEFRVYSTFHNYYFLFAPQNKNKKGNCNFKSDNSDFFLLITSLYFTFCYFILEIVSLYLTMKFFMNSEFASCYFQFWEEKCELWDINLQSWGKKSEFCIQLFLLFIVENKIIELRDAISEFREKKLISKFRVCILKFWEFEKNVRILIKK